MAVIFPRWTNLLPVLVAVGALVAGPAAAFGVWYWFSPKFTDVGYQPDQPIPFSHATHAGNLGMDCRYCHDTVDRSGYAAIPPLQTCMNCHATVKADSPLIAPLRQAWESGQPVAWQRVHILPDHAFFNHSVHVAAGVGCVSCHGRVDQMEKVTQVEPLSMSWCLSCHRNPEPFLRPRSEVTNMAWDAKAAAYVPSQDPGRTRPPQPPEHCSGCHR
jgi:hypothetical protein